MKIPKILQVLYSPSKVFKELAEKPSYKGVILILVLFIASNILAVYTFNTKHYVQKVKPDLFEEGSDVWTENAASWINCTESDDKIYGEHSVASTIINKSKLCMERTLPETINCSTYEFNEISFSLKLISSEGRPPTNVSLILCSGDSGCFMLNLTKDIKLNSWNNITRRLEGNAEWHGKDADWHAINGIKLIVEFPEKVNATLLLDALFFRGQYEPLTNYFLSAIGQYGMLYFMYFVIFWIIFGVILYLLTKYAGSELTWKHNLIISGYSLAPLFVQGVWWIILFLFLPRIEISLGTATNALTNGTLIFDLAIYSQFVFLAWGIIISAFAIRTLNNFTMGKSAVISSAAYLIAFLLARFLGF